MKGYGERLAWAMERAGISQSKLADLVGITQPSVSHLLSPEAKKSGHTSEIARILGVSAQWLATGRGEPLSPGSTGGVYDPLTQKSQDGHSQEEGPMSPEETELISVFRDLPPDSRGNILAQAKALAYDDMKRRRPFRKRPA